MVREYLENIKRKIGAHHPILQIVSYEWRRVHGAVISAAMELNYAVYRWNNVDGTYKWDMYDKTWVEDKQSLKEPGEAIEWYIEEITKGSKIAFIMEDLYMYFDSPQRREIITLLKKVARIPQSEGTLILSQPIRNLPIELEKDVYMLEIPLPDMEVLKRVIDEVVNKDFKLDIEYSSPEDWDYIAEAALGLTEMEAKYTFREIITAYKQLTKNEVPYIVQRKEQIIKKSGILEYFHPRESFSDVGGLENLKKWLEVRKEGFDPHAKDYGMTPPKGVLLLGIQGCGKSLVAKAIAAEWNLPLLRLDIGKVFGGIVGESEANIRKALAVAEAISPSILWIDEIEKGLAGVTSSDQTDSGTTARVFSTILTWMQEKEKPVFVVATANDISKLPPELLRKGRFDEIFFVDLPGKRSRREIWEIHLKKRLGKHRYKKAINKGDMNVDRLVDLSKGFSGAEIEEAVNEALYMAYHEEKEYPLMKHLEEAIRNTYPLSKTMGEIIIKLRKWAKDRTRLASSDKPEEIDSEEAKKAPKLRQEYYNPFI